MSEIVRIVEVGPRDGLQNEEVLLDVTTRVELIEQLAATGLKTIEAGAFVSPKWVPQMAGSAEVLAAVLENEKLNNIALPALVPNERGMADAIAAGVKEVAIFTAASDEFNQKNTNATIDESFERFAPVMALAKQHGIKVRGYVSTVIACPYSGKVAPEKVAEVATRLHDMGCYEISLGDTIGIGRPRETKAMLNAVLQNVGVDKIALHCHDTYGQALANIYVGLELGVRVFDSAVAGLGGCPYAKGASGNVATEDVVYLLNGEGFRTGIDLDKLVNVATNISQKLNRLPNSKVTLAKV